MKILNKNNLTNKSKMKRCMIHFHYIKWKITTFLIVVLVCLMFLQSGALWHEGTLDRLAYSYIHSKHPRATISSIESKTDKIDYIPRYIQTHSAAYAMKGTRPSMEDRFVIKENVNDTGIEFYGVFDGHGGTYTVDYLMNNLLSKLYDKIANIHKRYNAHEVISDFDKYCGSNRKPKEAFNIRDKSDEFVKYYNAAMDCIKTKCERHNKYLLAKLWETKKLAGEQNRNDGLPAPKMFDDRCYIEKNKINFGRMLTDELIMFDYEVVNKLWENKDQSGTTALIALINENMLTLANIGDSRAVLCDKNGQAVQMTMDHKASTPSEQKRILESGGFIGWDIKLPRTLGTIAITRALGDYFLKKFLIADPDIITYDLSLNNPWFLIIGCDGIWERFTNEEAVNFIKLHFHEPDFGAKSLVQAIYHRKSYDNLTVIIIVFKDGQQYLAGHKSN